MFYQYFDNYDQHPFFNIFKKYLILLINNLNYYLDNY